MTCRLPGGYVDDAGVVHRDAVLAPLSGREEELLADGRGRESASLATRVISRCVHRLGNIAPLTEETARRLCVADRQFLLLKLREATFGDRLQAVVRCPWPDCGKKVDINFSLQDVPVRQAPDGRSEYVMELSPEAAIRGAQGTDSVGDAERSVTFRLPNGGDQEALAPLLGANEALALGKLLGRCILGIGSRRVSGDEALMMLSPLARREIEARMEEIAPRVDLDLETRCHECGRNFVLPFDLQDFFFGELRISQDLLYREVHYLAFHYHWSEGEIMKMPRDRRRRYIEVLASEIERLNEAV